MKKIDYFDYIDQCVLGLTTSECYDDYIDQCLIYEFTCNGEYYHAHDFRSLISNIIWAVSSSEDANLVFSFEESYEQYSKQELQIANKFIDKLVEDKKKLLNGEQVEVR